MSPEKSMMRFFPTERTRCTVRPLINPRSSFGRTVSNRVTTFPASASLRLRAIRKMVSPSGTLLISRRRSLESRFHQERSDGVIDLREEQRAAYPAVDQRGNRFQDRVNRAESALNRLD